MSIIPLLKPTAVKEFGCKWYIFRMILSVCLRKIRIWNVGNDFYNFFERGTQYGAFCKKKLFSPQLTVNGTVRILTALSRILFVRKFTVYLLIV